MSNNPLSSYFRQVKTYIDLPSKNLKGVYDSSVIEYSNERKEIGVKAMTSADEMLLKNPDALLNGEAIIQTIKSCVSEIKDPRKLLSADIEVIMTTIRMVSFGKTMPVEAICPKCKTKNNLELDLEVALSSSDKLEESYVVNLENGLSIFLKPQTFEANLRVLTMGFEESNFFKMLEESDYSASKLKQMSQSLKKVSQLNFDLVSESVLAIVNEQANINVTDPSHIKEFMLNAEVDDIHQIEKEIQKINSLGLNKEYSATCSNEQCKHEWKAEFAFDMTRFFTNT